VSDTRVEPRGVDVVGRQRGIGRRTVLISILTLVSRILGLVREVLSAILFGDRSGIYDAFITAWRIPNLFRRFLGEGALATSLQTSLTEADARRGNDAGRELFIATLRVVLVILLALCAVVMLLVWLVPDRAPGTDVMWLGPDVQPIRELTVRLMPFVIFICLTAAVGGALNVRGHYTAPAFAPVVLNAVWIAALGLIALFVASDASDDPSRHMTMVRWLSWGVLAAGGAQLLVMLPPLRRNGLLGRGAIAEGRGEENRRAAIGVLKRAAPLALGAAVYQINVMIDGFMAEGLLPNGGPTVHYLANRVQQFPLALVAVAATTAVFPALTALGQERRFGELRRLHDATQRNVIFVALPAIAGLVALATPIVSVLFEYGAFGEVGVDRTAAALRVLAVAVLPAGAVGLVARTYYAVGDFKTPVRISCAMLGCNVVLNYVFIRGCGMDADGLALATTTTVFGNLLLLLPGLHGKLGLPPAMPGLASSLMRMGAGALACGAGAAGCWRLCSGLLGGALTLVLSIVAGAGLYVLVAELLRVPEWFDFRARLVRIASKFPPK